MDEAVKNLCIRRIRIEDADDISKIHASITGTAVKSDFKNIITKQIQADETAGLVAEIDGKVIGYIISYFLYSVFGVEEIAWITSFGIEPKLMGKEIGRRLARELFQIYRKKGIKNVLSSVPLDSVDLLSFFKALGFNRSSFINLKKDLDY
jgi:ribosomal protein S18 acetylase RimI-like enzyme